MRPAGDRRPRAEKPRGWTGLRRPGPALLGAGSAGRGTPARGGERVHPGGSSEAGGGEPPAHVRTERTRSGAGEGERATRRPGSAAGTIPGELWGASSLRPHLISKVAGERQLPPPPFLPGLPGKQGRARGARKRGEFCTQTAWRLRVRGTPSRRGGPGRTKLEIPVSVDPGPSAAAPKGGERRLGAAPSHSPAA